MTEGLRDSSYEQCAAVDKTTEDDPHPDYLELSNSTYDKIPEHHFDGEENPDNPLHEYTTPSDVADSLKDSLQYEKPIQVVRPLSKLQPQRLENFYSPELPKNRPISPDQCSLQLEKQNTSRDQTVENDDLSNKRRKSRRSKRPCVLGVGLVLMLIIGSGIATSMVLYFKEQDKSNTNKQQQDTAEENKSTIPKTTISTVSTTATMTESASSSGSTILQESNPPSPTTVSATAGRTESSQPTTTTKANVVTTTVTTSTPNPTTTTTSNPSSFASPTGMFKDCRDLKLNGYSTDGVYTIHPYLPVTTAVRVFCDMTTDGGGWTVFQHRKDGSVDFYLLWDNYKNGFGEPTGEYWLGNENLHQLTSLGTSDFYVRLEKFTGGWAYAKYNEFSVADESDGYRMRLKVGSYRGNAGDSIESHGTTNTNGYKFSTSDLDNDNAPSSCAVARKGAWWHNVCTWANLNGVYGNGTCADLGNCNFWYSLTNSFSGVKTSFMMARRV